MSGARHRTALEEVLAKAGLDPTTLSTPRTDSVALVELARRKERFGRALARDRGFPQGWWHGDDLESAVKVMEARLTELGLVAPLDLEDLRRATRGFVGVLEGEDLLRRHTIGHAAREANGFLAGMERPERLYAFADDVPGWELEEPVWLLLTTPERARLLEVGLLRPPQGVEREYDPVATPVRADD